MVDEAEKHAESDKKQREEVESRNRAEALVHATEKSLADAKDKISADTKKAVEKELKTVKEILADKDAGKERIDSSMQSLMRVSMQLGEALYKNAPNADPADGAADAGGAKTRADAGKPPHGEEEVADADFEEVPDDRANPRGNSGTSA